MATGVVALNNEQVLDMGQRVFQDFKLRNVEDDLYKVVDGVVTGLKVTDKLKEAISNVVSALPSVKTKSELPITFANVFSISSGQFSKTDNIELYKFSVTNGSSVQMVLNNERYITLSDKVIDYTISTVYNSAFKKFGVYATGYDTVTGSYQSFNYRDYSSPLDVSIGFTGTSAIYNTSSIHTIPYDNVKVKENYQPGLLPQSIPYTDSKPGYLPIPNVIPNDKVISTDIPLGWDDVKDTVIDFPLDDSTDIPIDTPVDGDISIPGDVSPSIGSFWGWLLDILKAILNAIKAIVTFLTTFFTKLMEILIDLVKSLFVPSDTYFTDSFNKLKNNFGNRLNYKTYTDLFDNTYSGSSIKDVVINWQGQEITIVKFTEFESFRSFFNTVVYAFFFFLLAIYNYNQLYKMLRGSDLISSGITIGHMQGQITPNEQLKLNTVMRRSLKS